MKTRFDLEQEILNCWNITDDILEIYEHVMERAESIPSEDIDIVANMLLGLAELYHLKFQKMFNTFETLIKKDEL